MTDTQPVATQPTTNQQFGFIAIIGPSNAGKSSLTNLLVGEKVAITSHKPQTTRQALNAILQDGQSQVALIDTPGIFQGKNTLDKFMIKQAWGAIVGVHKVFLMFTADNGITKNVEFIYKRLVKQGIEPILIVNKIDLVAKEKLLTIINKITQLGYGGQIYLISVKNNDGVDRLRQEIFANLPYMPWQFQNDELTDQNTNVFCAELTRESIMSHVHKEIPYSLMVETNQYIPRDNGSLYIYQTIHVTRPTHKAILIGKGGGQLKSIARRARIQMEQALHARVFLEIFVRITPNWQVDVARQ